MMVLVIASTAHVNKIDPWQAAQVLFVTITSPSTYVHVSLYVGYASANSMASVWVKHNLRTTSPTLFHHFIAV